MNKMTISAAEKQSLKLKKQKHIVHSGLVKLVWQRIDIPVPESKIIENGVELFKD